MSDTITLGGHTFHVHPIPTGYLDQPGIFAFVKKQGPSWQVLYVGETDNLEASLSTGIERHPAYTCAVRRGGATHIAARIQPGGRQARLDIAAILRRQFNPACNRQTAAKAS